MSFPFHICKMLHHFLLASWFLIRHPLLFKSLLSHKVLCCFTELLYDISLQGQGGEGEVKSFSFQKFDYSVFGYGFLSSPYCLVFTQLRESGGLSFIKSEMFSNIVSEAYFSASHFLHSFWNSHEY